MNRKLFSAIVELVGEFTQLDETEIFSKSRKQTLVDARYLIIFISRQLDIKLIYIQRFFKLKGFKLHYTTLFHASKRIEAEIKEDEYLKEIVDSILLQFDPSRVVSTEVINQ